MCGRRETARKIVGFSIGNMPDGTENVRDAIYFSLCMTVGATNDFRVGELSAIARCVGSGNGGGRTGKE
jgi:hypothetical protein